MVIRALLAFSKQATFLPSRTARFRAESLRCQVVLLPRLLDRRCVVVPRSCASTLVVLDSPSQPSIAEEDRNGGSGSAATTAPDSTRRVATAALQLRVAEAGKDAEIHLLVTDPNHPVPDLVPVGVTRIVRWVPDNAKTRADRSRDRSGNDDDDGEGAAAAAAAIEHAFVSTPDATHVLATFGQGGGAALARVATSLHAQLHDNVVEIQGRDAFVEVERGFVRDSTTRRFLTINTDHFPPAELQDAKLIPVETMRPLSRTSRLLWHVLPAGVVLAVILSVI